MNVYEVFVEVGGMNTSLVTVGYDNKDAFTNAKNLAKALLPRILKETPINVIEAVEIK